MFVTVVAWTFIALSGFGTIILILQNIILHTIFSRPEFNQSVQAPPPGMPPLIGFLMDHFQLFAFIFLVASALIFVSSIGLLKRWNWARICFIGFMVLAIVWQIAGISMQFYMLPTIRSQIADASMQGGSFMELFSVFITVVATLFGLGLSVLFGWIAKKLMSAPIAVEFQR